MMTRTFIAGVLTLTVIAGEAAAVIIMNIQDDFDDPKTVHSVSGGKGVLEFRNKLDGVARRLRQVRERDIIALFGKSVEKPRKIFAQPVAQPRMLGLSGVRHADPKLNRDHWEFYPVGTFAAVEIYYALDGVSPYVILFHLRVDEDFPKLTKDNLEMRLQWERERWEKLISYLDKRWGRVFPGKTTNVEKPPPPLRPRTAAPTPDISPTQWKELWHQLATADERTAYQAMDRLVLAGDKGMCLLEKEVPPEPLLDRQRLAMLIANLDSNRFGERDVATRELETLGDLAKPALEKAVRSQPTLETARRLRQLLARLDVKNNSDLLRLRRAVKVLACIDTPGAHQLLQKWAARTPLAFLTEESREMLSWLEGKEKRSHESRLR